MHVTLGEGSHSKSVETLTVRARDVAALRIHKKFWQIVRLETRANGNVGPPILLGQRPIAHVRSSSEVSSSALKKHSARIFPRGVATQTSSLSFLETMTCCMALYLSA